MTPDEERTWSERQRWRAAMYALYLREQGYSSEDTAELVIDRYPALAGELRTSLRERARKAGA